jgi:poly(3-hydroxybutyrate) depolymerase
MANLHVPGADICWSGTGSGGWQLDLDFSEIRHLPAVTIGFAGEGALPREITADLSLDSASWQPIGALPVANPSSQPIGQPARFLRLRFAGCAGDQPPAVQDIRLAVPSAKPTDPTHEIEYPCPMDGTMQPARFFSPAATGPVPLLVGLHTWSGDFRQRPIPRIEAYCAEAGWAYIHPDFRGPCWTPQACGSELVVGDILAAVDFVRRTRAVDPRRIYLVGGSGGGYHALHMAGRAPGMWAGVSAWVPISDLAAWHRECRAVGSGYADHIEKSCGGVPGSSPAVDAEVRCRSPLTYLAAARGLPLDINAGIHDGHRGSVPVSHSLRAFNAVALKKDRIAETDIAWMTEREEIPGHLRDPELSDPVYGDHTPLFRRQSGQARVTLFEGGHELVEMAAIHWLRHQQRDAV